MKTTLFCSQMVGAVIHWQKTFFPLNNDLSTQNKTPWVNTQK